MPIRAVIHQPSLPKYRVPVFRELASRLGMDLTIYHGELKEVPTAKADGFRAVPFNRLPWPLGSEAIGWQPMRLGYLTGRDADVLVFNWNIRHASLVPYLLTARRFGVPTVLWGHGFSKHERPIRRLLRWNVARLATAVLTYNHGVADTLVASGLPRERVFTALNTIDHRPILAQRERWAQKPEELEAFRVKNGLRSDAPHLLFVSRLDPNNRVDVLIDAVALLRERMPGIRATIVGGGTDGENLRAHAESRGVLGSAVHLTGPIYDEDVLSAWFLSADFFVYPSNIGLSIIHALGYGLPVLVGDRIDLHNPEIEALFPGDNGALFKHNSAEALAGTIVSLWNDQPRLARMRACAAASAREYFTLKRMVDGLDAVIRYAALRPMRDPDQGDRTGVLPASQA